MHIEDYFAQQATISSFEFFPPRTERGAEKLFETIRRLEALKPFFVSVTYGAGGSTRDITHDLVMRIKNQTSLDDAPRDLPGYDRSHDDFQHTAALVRCIRAFNREGLHPDTRGFGIGVAGFPEGHPGTPNRLLEMEYLKAKVDAGADYIVTQLFFDNRDFYDFRERCKLAGIDVPIIAGIMPVSTRAGIRRMAELALGARFPAALQRAVARCGSDPKAVERVGIHWATEQCRDLLDREVSGIHFYTLNQSDATLRIYRSLGLADARAIA